MTKAVKLEAIDPTFSRSQEVSELLAVLEPLPSAEAPSPQKSKNAIRTSLWASTLDGVFATLFSNITGGVLLSNFLVELHASPTEIGLLSSIPMLANLLQPIGAFLGDRTTSRHYYCLWIYGPARLLWLILAVGIAIANWQSAPAEILVKWTLAIVFVTHFMGALGSASWLSWLAALVPRRLRGRYFGIRNSAASLTNLISVPLLGLLLSVFPGNSIQGYSVLLVLGVVFGLVSLGFQFLMVDVNPQVQHEAEPEAAVTPGKPLQELEQGEERATAPPSSTSDTPPSAAGSWLAAMLPSLSMPAFLQDTNFLLFLLYFSFWMFAVNLSAPFFNLYLLDDLALDISWVTIYNSLQAGANLLLLIFWGRLADRVGNRAILITVGILVAITPLLWVGTGSDPISVWLWLPLLHILAGGTWAAIDLCNNNLQLGVAPVQSQATYFAIAAAVAGVSGALGTTAGGFLVEFTNSGGIPGLFALSAGVRLVALLPLIFVHEQRGQSLRQMMRVLFPAKSPSLHIEAELEDPAQ